MRRRRAIARLAKPGTYALVFECSEDALVSVGALGEVPVAKGYLVYIGSAFGPGGLLGRLRHHVGPLGRPRWHVDYLRRSASLVGTWCASGPRSLEHLWAARFSELRGFTIPRKGFGSSDCGCPTHLLHGRWRPTGRHTRARLATAHEGARVDYFGIDELKRAAGLPPAP
ncbi:MAG: GIY-YIG nuclease family protein [bacterium]|nr:hypothetical protein [Deltaproteobacteria bacterium]MCP4905325.1 GIY-YIG nuclease family protein [bacterium]